MIDSFLYRIHVSSYYRDRSMRFSVFEKFRKYLNAKRSLLDQKNGSARLRSLPLRVHLEINDRCNLRCFMCPRENKDIPKDTGDLDPAILEPLAPLISTAGYVGFAGNGEPFLHPRLFEILETIQSLGSVPSIVTNGTLLTEKRLNRLTDQGPSILNISFDGGTKETFESIRVGARFDEIVHSLETLLELKKKKGTPYPIVNFLVCVMRENSGELEEIVNRAGRLGVSKISFQTVFPFTERARQSMIDDLSELDELMKPVLKLAGEKGIPANLAPMAVGLKKRLEHRGQILAGRPSLFCENIWTTMHVGLNGDVRFCCFWTGEAVGNLFRDHPRQIWNHPEFQALRAKLGRGEIPDDCRECHVLDIHDKDSIETRMRSEFS